VLEQNASSPLRQQYGLVDFVAQPLASSQTATSPDFQLKPFCHEIPAERHVAGFVAHVESEGWTP